MKKNKYIYWWVIQTWYPNYGWEDVSFYDKKESTWKDVMHDYREYKIAEQAPHRIISRRELNEEVESD